MQKRKLGNSGLEIPPLVFGGNVFGWTVQESDAFRLLDAVVASGFNTIDTADIYAKWVPGNKGGESETIIGNWMKRAGNRQKVIIATKLGIDMDPASSGISGLARSYVFSAVEDSLRRLQTDYIDLYQSHRDDPNTPVEETLGAYGELIKQGKVRAIGASNYSPERLAQSLAASRKHGLPRYESLQPHYSLCERGEFEGALEQLCLREEIGVINYWPLASGFLTGKYRSEMDLTKSVRGGSVKKYFNERGFRILAALDEVSRKYRSAPVRVALAWLLARPSITAPIVSATSAAQWTDLIAAADLHLDQESIEMLTQASA
jgi:aryl-alcohol dehydrogenase-like predicted oxidoreductase